MSEGAQLMLWPDLPIPAAMPTPPRLPRMNRKARPVVQLSFSFTLRRLQRDDLDDDDDDPFYLPPVHRVIPAGTASPKPDTGAAPRSVWDMAAVIASAAEMLSAGAGRFGSAEQLEPKRLTVVRTDGAVKVVGAAYPANRWDEERVEQERQRRARQRPPKPTGKAKTRGKKVRAWDGEGDE